MFFIVDFRPDNHEYGGQFQVYHWFICYQYILEQFKTNIRLIGAKKECSEAYFRWNINEILMAFVSNNHGTGDVLNINFTIIYTSDS